MKVKKANLSTTLKQVELHTFADEHIGDDVGKATRVYVVRLVW